jgi:hypothetical protein
VAAHHQLDPPVLRQAPFGDVEHGHDLDARHDRRLERARRRFHFMQHAVVAIANPELIFGRVDMDIGGMSFDCMRDQLIDEANDWGLARHVLEPFGVILASRPGRGTEFVEGLVRSLLLFAIEAIKRALKVDREGHPHHHMPSRRRGDRGDSEAVQRIGHRDGDRRIVHRNRNGPRFAQEFQPQPVGEESGLGVIRSDRDHQSQEFRSRFGKRAFPDEAELGEDDIEPRAAFGS